MPELRRLIFPVATTLVALLAVAWSVLASSYVLSVCASGFRLPGCTSETIYRWDSDIGVAIAGAVVTVAGLGLWRVLGRTIVTASIVAAGLAIAWWPLIERLLLPATTT